MKKITFNEYKTLKGYNQKQMSVFLETFAQDAYKQGYDACKNDVSNGIDFDLLKIAIKATVGVGPVLYERIVEAINNLCFDEEME